MIRQLDHRTFASGQIATEAVASLAAQGFTVLVNNRPDGEDPDQPPASKIEEVAVAAGLKYHFVPIARGIGPADVETMAEAMSDAEGGKLLAFCRSGMRSALALGLAMRQRGDSGEQVRRCLSDAGFDPSPIAHLL